MGTSVLVGGEKEDGTENMGAQEGKVSIGGGKRGIRKSSGGGGRGGKETDRGR